jgi:molecular chaperone GrpE (heat shock protein)
MKRRIRIYEESLTQKRGAVEIDIILKEKNNLELQAENKRREENREIARLRNIHQMMEREIAEVRGEVEAITKELLLLEDSVGGAAKLKSHAMKVLKSY